MKTEQESKHGGARPGAGRKPKLQFEARELFYTAIDDRWEAIIAKLDKLIDRGDSGTIRWLLEQRVGKASQSLDVTTQGHKIASQDESESISEDTIAVFEELAWLSLVEGVSTKEALERFREWHKSTPRSPSGSVTS